MPAVLNTNMASLYAQKNLSTAQTDLATSVQRLSSGKRINSAKDDAAGYAVSEQLLATKNLTDQSIRNAQDAISLAQVAEGALDVVGKILQRSLTLVTQLENGSLETTQETSIKAEITGLLAEIDNVVTRTQFQGSTNPVFSSTADTTFDFTMGAGVNAFTLTIPKLDDFTLTSASTSVQVRAAIQTNSDNRSSIGTQLAVMNYAVDNMQTLSNNLADARSRILDTDYAAETAALTRGQILQQAATSMLAQANQMPNVILTLLK